MARSICPVIVAATMDRATPGGRPTPARRRVDSLRLGDDARDTMETAAVRDSEASYRPSDDEPYMSERQLEYFAQKLQGWRAEVLREARETRVHLQAGREQQPAFLDRAAIETEHALELRARDRQRKLISKIDQALHRIETGDYGYCKETGEPIGLARLEARSIAAFSVEGQELHERRERMRRAD